MRARISFLIFTMVLGSGGVWLAQKLPARKPAALSAPVIAPPAPLAPDSSLKSTSKAHCENFYKTVCHKKGPTRDPSGVVNPDFDGEIKALRVYEAIVRAHPDWNLDQVDEELVKQIYTPEIKSRIERAYEWTRSAMEKWVARQPASVFSDSERRYIHGRIQATKLELPGPASVYDDERDLFTKSDVFYERTPSGKLRMRVGGAFLMNIGSWFNLVFTIAHEFAHAVDPCEIKAAGLQIPAYNRLSACFLKTGLVSDLKQRKECVQNDQLSEAFADWLAVKVTAAALRDHSPKYKPKEMLSAARNAVRDLCEQENEDEVESEFHPSPEVRIDRIFGENPEIREILECPAAPARVIANDTQPTQYCDFN